MTNKETAKKIITTTAHTLRTATTLTYKGAKLFINELTKPTNTQHKCKQCGKPSGKYKYCYQCYKRRTH